MTPAEQKREKRREQAIADVLAIPDSRGRLHNERSGEADREYGMSEMERIIAAQDRDENGRRVTPRGAAPSQMEASDVETFNPRASLKDRLVQTMGGESFDVESSKGDFRKQCANEAEFRKYESKIAEVGEWLAETLPDGSRRCRLVDCHVPLNDTESRERHVWQAYDRGHRQHEHVERLKELGAPQDLINEANVRLQTDWHFRAVMDRLRSRKK